MPPPQPLILLLALLLAHHAPLPTSAAPVTRASWSNSTQRHARIAHPTRCMHSRGRQAATPSLVYVGRLSTPAAMEARAVELEALAKQLQAEKAAGDANKIALEARAAELEALAQRLQAEKAAVATREADVSEKEAEVLKAMEKCGSQIGTLALFAPTLPPPQTVAPPPLPLSKQSQQSLSTTVVTVATPLTVVAAIPLDASDAGLATAFEAYEDDAEGDAEDDDAEYEVDRIVDERLNHERKEYLIRWEGYDSLFDTWEPAETIEPLGDGSILRKWQASHSFSSLSPSASVRPRRKRRKLLMACPPSQVSIHLRLSVSAGAVVSASLGLQSTPLSSSPATSSALVPYGALEPRFRAHSNEQPDEESLESLRAYLAREGVAASRLAFWSATSVTRIPDPNGHVHRDAYYYSPDGARFRSRIEVLRFLTGAPLQDGRRKEQRGLKCDSDSDDDKEVEEEEPFCEPVAPLMRKHMLTVSLTPINGSLGIALSGNQVTAIHPGGAAAATEMNVGDMVTEVDGKSTHIDTFGRLLPMDKSRSIKLRLMRLTPF